MQDTWSFTIPSSLVDVGIFRLHLHRQTFVARFWYISQCAPGSPTYINLSDTSLDHVLPVHHRCPHPFSFRAKTLLNQMSLPQPTTSATPFLWRLGSCCQCTSVGRCQPERQTYQSMQPNFFSWIMYPRPRALETVFQILTRVVAFLHVRLFLPQSCLPYL